MKNLNLIAAVITIFVFLTGITRLPDLIGPSNNESSNPIAISFPIFLLVTLIIFGCYFFVELKIFRSLYENNLTTVSNLYHEAGDYFFVVFFGTLGVVFAVILGDAYWGLDKDILNSEHLLPAAIYALIMVPGNYYMAHTAKSHGSRY